MGKGHSFDIVSEVDFQEVSNAVDQAKKEIATRYDFKGSTTSIDWNKKEETVSIQSENETRLKATIDVLQTKLAKRQVPLKSVQLGSIDRATGGSVRQTAKIQNGIPIEKAKEIVKYIKQSKLKVQASIQEDKIRVQASKIDLLQEIIQEIKKKDFDLDLQFINYR